MKFLYFFFVVIFILSAAVQYNDPDPWVWIGLYLVPAFLCYHKSKKKGERLMYFIVGLVYFLWAVELFPNQWEGLMFNELSMKTMNIELARESLGLGICAVALWICAYDTRA